MIKDLHEDTKEKRAQRNQEERFFVCNQGVLYDFLLSFLP
jgi:hypothetical protein